MKSKILNQILFSGICYFLLNYAYAENNVRHIFPLDNYVQQVNFWLRPTAVAYKQNLLGANYQNARLKQLKHLYFGTECSDTSPWSKAYIQSLLAANTHKTIYSGEEYYLHTFNNQGKAENKLGYTMNYRVHNENWIQTIQINMNLSQLQSLSYNQHNRAIATDNMLLRILPTNDPSFFNNSLPGEGYPLDNLQASSIYAGTPLYIIGSSSDQQWLLILAPDYIGWVSNKAVARVDNKFIQRWQKAAYAKLAGIIQTNVSLIDQNNNYRFTGYVGMILPILSENTKQIKVMLAVKQLNGTATIQNAVLPKTAVVRLPLMATPENFARIIKTLQLRPYGWGGLGFYNDCSAEMKAIFSVFGIYLPRNTSNQGLAGKVVDLKTATPANRLAYVIKNAVPLLTLIHIKGHILLYIGNYVGSNGLLVPLSYQQRWGIAPYDQSYRAIVGQSVFLPLLSKYLEEPNLAPEVTSSVFELIYLNQWPLHPLKQDLSELLY